ncbi:hypothetical protein J3Q64DRAFT_1699863 [Phycomyces blakesleeanus]|uniref:Uncharacterized protein n=1 Tax=Phycomyces blakesleeanus TaxID=4837 RepID=A0ABR3AVD7_PHYBL
MDLDHQQGVYETTNSKQPNFQQKQCANLQRWGQPQKGLATKWQRSYQILAYHAKNPKYIQAYNAMYNISRGEKVRLAYRAALPFVLIFWMDGPMVDIVSDEKV